MSRKKDFEEEEREDGKEEEMLDEEPETEREVRVGFEPDVSMVISVNKRGSLDVEIKGVWTARQIRAIQLAVIKAYRNMKKEAIIKKEE